MNLYPSRPLPPRPTALRELNPRVDPYAEERERIRRARPEGSRFDPLSRDLLEFYSEGPSSPQDSMRRFSGVSRPIPPDPYFRQPSDTRPTASTGQSLPYSTLLTPNSRYRLPAAQTWTGHGPMTPIQRSNRRAQTPESRRMEAYERHLDAEERAGRRLSPGNQDLIDYYSSPEAGRSSARRQETPSPTPFLGRESSSPTFTGSSNTVFLGRDGIGKTFLGSQSPLFTGRDSITDYRLFGPRGVFLGRGSVADPVSSETVVETSGIADGIVGMMGGGLVGSRTPFRKGRAMDRMVSEMTRNISKSKK